MRDGAPDIVRILRRHGRGECFLFGVVTSAMVGRMELLSLKNENDKASIQETNGWLNWDKAPSSSLRFDSGDNCVIGLRMQCFLIEQVDSGSTRWMMTAPIAVHSWDVPLYHAAIDHCHSADASDAFWLAYEFDVQEAQTLGDLGRRPVPTVSVPNVSRVDSWAQVAGRHLIGNSRNGFDIDDYASAISSEKALLSEGDYETAPDSNPTPSNDIRPKNATNLAGKREQERAY